jgi:hypothetical protein
VDKSTNERLHITRQSNTNFTAQNIRLKDNYNIMTTFFLEPSSGCYLQDFLIHNLCFSNMRSCLQKLFLVC